MIRYRPGKFSHSLFKHDWNRLLQEITTVLIGVGVGLYLYETQIFNNILGIPGTGIIPETSRPYMKFGTMLLVACLLVKIILYFSILDANALKNGKITKPRRRRVDVNGIFQEILTAVLGLSIGMFTTPVVKNMWVLEQTEYPDPTWGISLMAACLVCKILLYAEAIDLNASGKNLWQPQKVKPFLGEHDWNHAFQEVSSVCIGIAAGLYAYESGLIVRWMPEKMQSQFGAMFKQLGAPNIFENQTARPYLMAGAALLIICVVLKLLIYCSLWNANSLRDSLLHQGGKRYTSNGIDYQGIANEIVTFLLTTILSVVTTPVMKNVFMQQKSEYQQQWWVWLAIAILGIIKIGVTTGALEVGTVHRHAKRR